MNLTLAEARSLREEVRSAQDRYPDVSFVLFPPATALAALAALPPGGPALGAQNCHFEPKGAFTGEISAEQARDAGAAYVLVGHSERRRLFCENDLVARQKMLAAWRCGLVPMLCAGETLAERERRETRSVLARQIARALEGAPARARFLLAYEPVWAIGTGVVAQPDQVAEAHRWIREELAAAGLAADGGGSRERRVPVLYGGSVDPGNAGALAALPEVDGFLVGGASLVSASFLAIADALQEASRGPAPPARVD